MSKEKYETAKALAKAIDGVNLPTTTGATIIRDNALYLISIAKDCEGFGAKVANTVAKYKSATRKQSFSIARTVADNVSELREVDAEFVNKEIENYS